MTRSGGSLRCSNTAAILGWSGHSPVAGRSDRAGSRLFLACAATPAEWSNRGTPKLSNVQFSSAPQDAADFVAPDHIALCFKRSLPWHVNRHWLICLLNELYVLQDIGTQTVSVRTS
jgi:hypothetical protein